MTKGNVAEDEYTVTVKDQYGTAMKNAKYYINGTQVPTAQTIIKADNAATKVLEIKAQSKGSEVSKTWRVNVPFKTEVTAVDNTDYTTIGSASADNVTQLDKILAAAAANGTPDIITFTGIEAADAQTVVAAEDTLVIAENATLDDADLGTYNGNVTNNGTMIFDADKTVANTGKTFTNNGTVTSTGDLTIEGTFKNNKTLTVTGKDVIVGTGTNTKALFENAEGATTKCKDLTGTGTYTNNGRVEATGKINLTKNTTFKNYGTATAATGIQGFVLLGDNSVTTTDGSWTATTIVEPKAEVTVGDTSDNEVTIVASEDGFAFKAAINLSGLTPIAGEGTVDGVETGADAETTFAAYLPKLGTSSDSNAINMEKLGTQPTTLTKDSITLDAEKKTVTFNYTVSGTVGEINDDYFTALGFSEAEGHSKYCVGLNYKFTSTDGSGANVFQAPNEYKPCTSEGTHNDIVFANCEKEGTKSSIVKYISGDYEGWTFTYNFTFNCTAETKA